MLADERKPGDRGDERAADGDDEPTSEAAARARGRRADSPQEIPGQGWRSVLLRTKQQTKEDNVTILAAGVAFYLMLALAPALVAVLSVYGFVATPADVARHVNSFGGALPADVRSLVTTQLKSAGRASNSKLGVGLVVGLVAAMIGASKGARSLIETVNIAFDEEEHRGFMKIRLLALLFTAAGLVIMIVALGAITVLPAIGDHLGTGGRVAASVLRWPMLALIMIFALSCLYRYAPDRDNARWRWVTPGALVATVLWLLGSALFTLYADHFSSFGDTYGALGAVVVLLLWLFLTAFVILLGAELNAEAERQTEYDSTKGEDRPLGERNAYAADTVGPDEPPKDTSRK